MARLVPARAPSVCIAWSVPTRRRSCEPSAPAHWNQPIPAACFVLRTSLAAWRSRHARFARTAGASRPLWSRMRAPKRRATARLPRTRCSSRAPGCACIRAPAPSRSPTLRVAATRARVQLRDRDEPGRVGDRASATGPLAVGRQLGWTCRKAAWGFRKCRFAADSLPLVGVVAVQARQCAGRTAGRDPAWELGFRSRAPC
jgi:hypothetical protein